MVELILEKNRGLGGYGDDTVGVDTWFFLKILMAVHGWFSEMTHFATMMETRLVLVAEIHSNN